MAIFDTMKFTFHVAKKHVSAVGRSLRHNTRSKATTSQLRPASWFTPDGHHTIRAWDDAKIREAKKLAKRKDAVVALSFVVQVGNQYDWRMAGTPDLPEGPPLDPPPGDIHAMAKAVEAWALKEFGERNVVGIDLHTDESSPHVHLVVTPIFGGKLAQKEWIGGSAKMQAIRRRAFDFVSRAIECEYTPGNPGGDPHRPELRAGEEAMELVRPLLELHEKDPEAAAEMSDHIQQELDERRAQIFCQP